MAILTERKVWRRPAEERPAYERPTKRAAQLPEHQQAHLMRALGVLRDRLGSWGKLADAMHVTKSALSRVVTGATKPHAGLAVRAARVAGMSPDDLLRGKFIPPGACPTCGRRGFVRG